MADIAAKVWGDSMGMEPYGARATIRNVKVQRRYCQLHNLEVTACMAHPNFQYERFIEGRIGAAKCYSRIRSHTPV